MEAVRGRDRSAGSSRTRRAGDVDATCRRCRGCRRSSDVVDAGALGCGCRAHTWRGRSARVRRRSSGSRRWLHRCASASTPSGTRVRVPSPLTWLSRTPLRSARAHRGTTTFSRASGPRATCPTQPDAASTASRHPGHRTSGRLPRVRSPALPGGPGCRRDQGRATWRRSIAQVAAARRAREPLLRELQLRQAKRRARLAHARRRRRAARSRPPCRCRRTEHAAGCVASIGRRSRRARPRESPLDRLQHFRVWPRRASGACPRYRRAGREAA